MPAPATIKRDFGQKGNAYLVEFYEKYGSTTTEHKLNLLKKLMGDRYFYAVGGEVDDEMRLGSYEYDFLMQRGLIEPALL